MMLVGAVVVLDAAVIGLVLRLGTSGAPDQAAADVRGGLDRADAHRRDDDDARDPRARDADVSASSTAWRPSWADRPTVTRRRAAAAFR